MIVDGLRRLNMIDSLVFSDYVKSSSDYVKPSSDIAQISVVPTSIGNFKYNISEITNTKSHLDNYYQKIYAASRKLTEELIDGFKEFNNEPPIYHYISILQGILDQENKEYNVFAETGFPRKLLSEIQSLLDTQPNYEFNIDSIVNLNYFIFSRNLNNNTKIIFDFGKVVLLLNKPNFDITIIFEENGSLNYHLTNKHGNRRMNGSYELDFEYLANFDDLFLWFERDR